MTCALIAGSFDPITLGHLDLVMRASRFSEDIVVAVGMNSAKNYRFSHDQRLHMVQAVLAHFPKVRVMRMDTTLLECALEVGADVVVKGVRTCADLDWELVQATVNRDFGDIETVLMPTRPELAIVSSSLVRELLIQGMDISRYVPAAIIPLMTDNEASEKRPTLK